MTGTTLFQRNLTIYRSQNPHAQPILDHLNNGVPDSQTLIEHDEGEWDFEGVQVIYAYGSPGEKITQLFEWLKKNTDRQVIFLENDLERIHLFLQSEAASKILEHSQIQCLLFQDVERDLQPFAELTWKHLLKPIEVISIQKKDSVFEQLKARLLFESSEKNEIVEEFLDGGTFFYQNLYHNFLNLPNTLNGSSLFSQFKNTPAIICGAGPSLQKNGPLLIDAHEKALIFAGGSSINALRHLGVTPHFGCAIDPNPEEYKRFSKIEPIQEPVFVTCRTEPRAVSCIFGPKLYIGGASGYPTPNWMEEQLNLQTKGVEEGKDVTTFSVALAHALGCNPIVLVGVDLAYTDQKKYAAGVIEDHEDVKHSAVTKKDIFGNQIETEWRWIASGQWLEAFCESHPETDWINATEGGIGIAGVPNRTLKQCLSEFRIEGSFSDKMNEAIQDAAWNPVPKKEQIQDLYRTLNASLAKCDELLTDLEILLQESAPIGKIALFESDLFDEPAYEAILQIFRTVYEHKERSVDLTVDLCRFLRRITKQNREIIKKAT